MKTINRQNNKGFTLVELLIVIAVLGVLAAVVLIAINPLEQLARGRDAGRKSSVSSMGDALEAYFTAHNAVYPSTTNTWMSSLQTSGEIKVVPNVSVYSATTAMGCPAGVGSQNGICYGTNAAGTDAVVYLSLESTAERTKCAATATAWYTWASANGSAGVFCGAAGAAPAAGASLALQP